MNYYWLVVIIGIVGLVGIVVYARLQGANKAQSEDQQEKTRVDQVEKEAGGRSGLIRRLTSFRLFRSDAHRKQDDIPARPTEDLVDVVDIVDGFLETKHGDLVALLELPPILMTSDASLWTLNDSFAKVIASLPAGIHIQIVSMPIPNHLGDLIEDYASWANHWRSNALGAASEGNPEKEDILLKRYQCAADFGEMILEKGARSTHRASLAVLTTKLPPMANEEQKQQAAYDFRGFVQTVDSIFHNQGVQVSLLPAELALHFLWYGYNPDISGQAAQDLTLERFKQICVSGTSEVPRATAISHEDMQMAMNDPRKSLSSVLAPAVVQEDRWMVHFHTKTMLLYFIPTFNRPPTMRQLEGDDRRYANGLFVSYYLHIHTPAEIAKKTRDAETAKEAQLGLSDYVGRKPSFKTIDELQALEHTRYGAETEKNVMRSLGLYIGVLVDTEDVDKVVKHFEGVLRSAGLRYVPADWSALNVWRSMLPLGQRHHRFEGEDRNVFSADLARMNPISGVSLYDPIGDFLGFTRVADDTYMPVAVRRERGSTIGSSDAIVGAPGSGKSFMLKNWVTDWISRGQRTIVLDPKMEFGPITKALGGQTLEIDDASGFNLIQFAPIPVKKGSKAAKMLGTMVFLNNLSAIETLYAASKGEDARVNGSETSLFIKGLRKAMADKGLVEDDPAGWEANAVLLRDVYEIITRELYMEDQATAQLIRNNLEQYASTEGYFFKLFNTPIELDLDRELINIKFGISIFQIYDYVPVLMYHFALRIATQQAIRQFLLSKEDKPLPFRIVIDEASQFLVTPQIVSSVVRILSVLPAFNIFAHLAFQTYDAIQDADSMISGARAASNNTLQGTIPAYWLFGQEVNSAQKACEALRLPQGMANKIQGFHAGECLLSLPRAGLNLDLRIFAPDSLRELFNTQTEDMKSMVDELLEIIPQGEEEAAF